MPHRYQKISGVSAQAEQLPVYRMGIVFGMTDDKTSATEQTWRFCVASIPTTPAPSSGISWNSPTRSMQVVGEGIETEAERAVVAELGCHLLQGYFFARPAPPFCDIDEH